MTQSQESTEASANLSSHFNSIEELVADLAHGKMVILLDDEDRENEGDLVMLASQVRPEDINFMAKNGRGLICLTLTAERCKQLSLPLMVEQGNDSRFGTNFTLSIEASEGVTTGISAYDRAHTVRTAIAPDASADDLVQPGHIFPITAQPGGVLTRAGHTEAGCDLARLAGSEPAAVIVEILNDDGSMARRDDLMVFAAKHDLKIGTIADLIQHRLNNESSIELVAETPMETEFGDFFLKAYRDQISDQIHFALVKGTFAPDDEVMVRVHLNDALADGLPVENQNFGWPLRDALRRIGEEGAGVAVILRWNESNDSLIGRVKALAGHEAAENLEGSESSDQRTYGIGAQILLDLGVHKMRLLSAPKQFHALAGFNLQVVDYIWDKEDASA